MYSGTVLFRADRPPLPRRIESFAMLSRSGVAAPPAFSSSRGRYTLAVRASAAGSSSGASTAGTL
jgi:hypothetical protein